MIIGLKWPGENLGTKCAILGRKRHLKGVSLSFWQRYTSTILHYKVKVIYNYYTKLS